MNLLRSTVAVCLALVATNVQAQPVPGLRVPAGFEVTEFADSRLANDIYCLTIGPQGRVVVSGRGYIRILYDDDGDGRADRAEDFARAPRDGAMGLCWEGSALYATGDGGLRRFFDKNGDGVADGPSQLLWKMKTGGEHAAHAIRRGPDGWLYVLCGNNTGIDKSYALLPTSPIKDPVAGCVLRFSPDFNHCEIVAHGFRNPYGMDFSQDGELFTFDSDNERCVSLPWYEPTRFYHVIPGGHYGWLSPQRAQFWRMPPYFVDVVAPVAYLGRGSPTGVACYRHSQFPEEYRGGFFLCDWTFGKIHFAKLDPKGSSYTSTPKVFLESTGDNGFAPTACAVHPTTGDLYVAIGGRGTRGGVYRIRCTKAQPGQSASEAPKRRSLDWQPTENEQHFTQAIKGPAPERLRALLHLERHRYKLTRKELFALVTANWEHEDRYILQVTARLIGGLTAEEILQLATWNRLSARACRSLALAVVAKEPAAALIFVNMSLECRTGKSSADELAELRLLQLVLGDLVAENVKGTVWEGYSLRGQPSRKLQDGVAKCCPAALTPMDRDWNREASRLWALLGIAPFRRTAEIWTKDSDPVEDLHYLFVFTRAHERIAVANWWHGWGYGELAPVADALLALDRKMKQRGLKQDTNWSLRLTEMYADLILLDRIQQHLPKLLIDHPEFGRPEHIPFTRAFNFDRPKAAKIVLAKSQKDASYQWTPLAIDLLTNLDDSEIRLTLEKLWGQAGLDASILPVLARNPQPADRPKFLDGLTSPRLDSIRVGLDALDKMPARGDESLPLLRALGNLPDKQQEIRQRITRRLSKVTGQDLGSDRNAWIAWLAKNHPKDVARLTNPDGVDVPRWQKRLANLDWSAGSAERGQKVFHKASCVHCHSGSQALGPDLAGVTQRFSRADLFTAILQPSRDVPARYQTTLVETHDGKVYQGIVIYDAVDGLILQTGATATVRVAGANIALRRVSATSLMPAGLLDALADEEIADLYAYLRHLGKK